MKRGAPENNDIEARKRLKDESTHCVQMHAFIDEAVLLIEGDKNKLPDFLAKSKYTINTKSQDFLKMNVAMRLASLGKEEACAWLLEKHNASLMDCALGAAFGGQIFLLNNILKKMKAYSININYSDLMFFAACHGEWQNTENVIALVVDNSIDLTTADLKMLYIGIIIGRVCSGYISIHDVKSLVNDISAAVKKPRLANCFEIINTVEIDEEMISIPYSTMIKIALGNHNEELARNLLAFAECCNSDPQNVISYHTLALDAAQAGYQILAEELLIIVQSKYSKEQSLEIDYNMLAKSAALGGHEALVDHFIAKAKIEAQKVDYGIIAAGAASGGHWHIAEKMLSKAKADQTNQIDYTQIITGAITAGYKFVVEQLLNMPEIKDPQNVININYHTLANNAARAGHWDLIEMMLQRVGNAQINHTCLTIICLAIYYDHICILKKMTAFIEIKNICFSTCTITSQNMKIDFAHENIENFCKKILNLETKTHIKSRPIEEKIEMLTKENTILSQQILQSRCEYLSNRNEYLSQQVDRLLDNLDDALQMAKILQENFNQVLQRSQTRSENTPLLPAYTPYLTQVIAQNSGSNNARTNNPLPSSSMRREAPAKRAGS